MTAPELKPCPFCGGEASACPDPNHSTGWDIGCFNGSCEVEPHVWSVHRDTAEMQWNTRPKTDRLIAEAVAAERERCARIADDEFGGRCIADKIRGKWVP